MVPQRGESVLDAEGAADPSAELEEARKAYEHARQVYKQRLAETR